MVSNTCLKLIRLSDHSLILGEYISWTFSPLCSNLYVYDFKLNSWFEISTAYTSYENEYAEPTEVNDQSQTGYFDEEGIYHSYAKTVSGDSASRYNDSLMSQSEFSTGSGSVDFNQDLGNLAANKGFSTTFSQIGSGNEMQVGGSSGTNAGGDKVFFTEEVSISSIISHSTFWRVYNFSFFSV